MKTSGTISQASSGAPSLWNSSDIAACQRALASVRATFSWLIAIDGGFRLAWFLFAGLIDHKLLVVYLLCLFPMAAGLYSGNKVHLDMTSEGMLKAIGVLLMISGAMLFLKAAL